MKKHIYEGKNLEQTLQLALYELNVNENELIYIYKEEKAGLLKGKKIVLECVKLTDVSEYTKELTKEFLNGMNIEGNLEMKLRDGVIHINIISDSNSLLIGKKGNNLEALNTFLKQAIYTTVGKYVQIIVDIENYKDKQKYFLERDLKKVAREVLKTKTEIKLDPMKAYERKLVHDFLTSYKDLETSSNGIEPNRCVVIKYKED